MAAFTKHDRTYLQIALEIAEKAERHSLDDEDMKDAAYNAAVGLRQMLETPVEEADGRKPQGFDSPDLAASDSQDCRGGGS